MKRFPNRLAARAAAAAIGLSALSGFAKGQEKPIVSARPGQRTAREMPAATTAGIPMTLEQSISLALSNNQDLNVTVNAAEATRFTLFQTLGIYDPLASGIITRAHTESPATSTLVGAQVNTVNTFDARAQISQLATTGGIFTLGFAMNKTDTNSSFSFLNPSYSSNLSISMNQPLLRNF